MVHRVLGLTCFCKNIQRMSLKGAISPDVNITVTIRHTVVMCHIILHWKTAGGLYCNKAHSDIQLQSECRVLTECSIANRNKLIECMINDIECCTYKKAISLILVPEQFALVNYRT